MYQITWKLAQRGHTIISHRRNQAVPYITYYRTRKLLEFIKDCDVIYARVDGAYGKEAYSLCKVLALFSRPVVWEINAPLEEYLVLGHSRQTIIFLNAKRRKFAKLVDAAICVSEEMKDYAEGFLGIKNAYVIPNGSDELMFSPEKRSAAVYKPLQTQFKVLWSGSPKYPWQGINIVRDVAKKTYTVDKDIAFILIGRKQDFGFPMEENMIVVDEMEYDALPPFIASADVGLCLYYQCNWYKTFCFSPLKLFDYMSSGLPIIATDTGQIGRVIKNGSNGILTDNDAADVAEKILHLKRAPNERKKLGEIARMDVCNYYNWTRAAMDTESVLMNVVGGRL